MKYLVFVSLICISCAQPQVTPTTLDESVSACVAHCESVSAAYIRAQLHDDELVACSCVAKAGGVR